MPTGESLLSSIRLCCGKDQAEYHREKNFQLQNLGFCRKRFDGSLSLHVDGIKELMDGYLGYKELRATNIDVFETRFDIKLPLEKGQSGTIKFLPVRTKGSLIIQQKNPGILALIVRFHFNFYVTPFKTVPIKNLKCRASTKFFDLIWSKNELTLTYNIQSMKNDANSLDEWIELFRLRVLVLTGPVIVKLKMENAPFISSDLPFQRCDADLVIAEEVLDILQSLEKLLTIANDEKITVTLDEIMYSAPKILEVASFIFCDPKKRSVEIIMESSFPKEMTSNHIDMVFFDHIPLGDYCFTFYSLVRFEIVSGRTSALSRSLSFLGAGISKTRTEYETLKKCALIEAGIDSHFERDITWQN